jgi:hypothetical protein
MSIDLNYRFGRNLHSSGALEFANYILEEAKIATHELNLDNVAHISLESSR